MDNFLAPETRDLLGLEHRYQLLGHLLRDRVLFNQARGLLRPEYLNHADEPHLRVVWTIALKVAAEDGDERLFINPAQAWALLSAECKSFLANNKGVMPDEYYDQLFSDQGLLAWIFKMEPQEISLAWGRQLLRKLLEERFVQEPMYDAVNNASNRALTNMPQMLRAAQDRQALVESLQTSGPRRAIEHGWKPTKLNKIPTGVDFIDHMLDGGDVAGEVYGLLGVQKSGKTTLALQLTVAGAEYDQTEARKATQRGERHVERPTHYVGYETATDEIRNRLLVRAAEIRRDVVENWDESKLSTTGHLKPYEQVYFKDEIRALGLARVPGERERFARGAQLMVSNIRLHDMTTCPGNVNRGGGGIEEIAVEIRKAVQEDGCNPRRVIIDYAQTCVRRQVEVQRLRTDMYYHLLTSFGHTVLRLLAIPFQCPVWVLGQLNAQSNKKTSSSRHSYADAAGSGSFSENMWYCFQIGMPSEDLQAMIFEPGVARRSAKADRIVVRLDGAMGRIVPDPGIIPDATGRLIRQEEANGSVRRAKRGSQSNASFGAAEPIRGDI